MIKLLFDNGGEVLFLTDGNEYRYRSLPPKTKDCLVGYFGALRDAIHYAKTGEMPRNTTGYRRVA